MPSASSPAVAESLGDRISRMLRPSLTLVAIVAVGVAFVDAVRDAGEVPLPNATWMLWSVLLSGAGLVAAAGAWAKLVGGFSLWTLLPGFSMAQLAKYVPGSVWQGVSQVLYAEGRGVGRSRATLAFLLQLWTQLLAAGVIAGLVLLGGRARWPWLLFIGSIAAGVSLWRPLLFRLAEASTRIARGRLRRLQALPEELPSQRVLVSAALFGVVTIVAGGAGYAALLVGPTVSREGLIVVGAFATAWVIGFLVVPLPAGLGVREFVLLGLLEPPFGAATVLAAAVGYRLLTIVAELLLVLAAFLLQRGGAGRRRDGHRRGAADDRRGDRD